MASKIHQGCHQESYRGSAMGSAALVSSCVAIGFDYFPSKWNINWRTHFTLTLYISNTSYNTRILKLRHVLPVCRECSPQELAYLI